MESDSEWSELNEEVEENSKNDHNHLEVLSQSNISEPSVINYGEHEIVDHVNMNEDEKKKSMKFKYHLIILCMQLKKIMK